MLRELLRRGHVGICGGADTKTLTNFFSTSRSCTVSRMRWSGSTGRACGEDHRGRRRDILEFVGDDIDVGCEQFQRLDVGVSAQVAFCTTSNAGESGSGENT